MSVGTIAARDTARDLRNELHQRWADASPTQRTVVQTGVFVLVVVAAYHYSIFTLIQSLNVDTPLAYIGLVPFIALGLAAARTRLAIPEPAIHDRQLDYIVGLPLIAIAMAMNLILPRRLSAMYWIWRIDMVSFPIFVAGVASIIFGVRALWRQRAAVAYLFLAWPLPYTLLLLRLLNSFTNITLSALKVALKVVHVASPIRGGDGSLFQVVHGGKAFPISVVSACSGVNGMVGFLLVGAAFVVLITGPRVWKTVWLALGMGLLWAVNLGRILFIFWAGKTWGERFAFDVLHPFVGLVTFNLGVLAMILLLRPFGLRLAASKARPAPTGRQLSIGSLAVPRVFGAITIVALFGGVLGLANSGLRSYDLVANATGEPKLASFSLNPATPTGWQPRLSARFDWTKTYFGQNSTWLRYTYSQGLGHAGGLSSTLPITADVINTSDLRSFSAYGIEACYRFHGFHLRDVAQVNLGGGITGQALSYTAKRTDWTVVYWVWPVRSGKTLHYERVVLYMLNAGGLKLQSPVASPGVQGLPGALSTSNPKDRQLLTVRSYLVSFARDIIKGQAAIRPGSKLPARTLLGGRAPASPRNTDAVTRSH